MQRLLLEATLEGRIQGDCEEDVVISRDDFSGPMHALLDQQRALGLASRLARDSQQEQMEVVGALRQAQEEGFMIGGAENGTSKLDKLRSDGLLRLWNSGQVNKETVTSRRIASELGIKGSPDEALGLRPSAATYVRYVGVRWLGLLGALALVLSACVPSAYLAVVRLSAFIGAVCTALYLSCFLVLTWFPKHVDALVMRLQVQVQLFHLQRTHKRANSVW